MLWEYVTHQLIGNKFMKGEQQFEVRHFFDVPRVVRNAPTPPPPISGKTTVFLPAR